MCVGGWVDKCGVLQRTADMYGVLFYIRHKPATYQHRIGIGIGIGIHCLFDSTYIHEDLLFVHNRCIHVSTYADLRKMGM